MAKLSVATAWINTFKLREPASDGTYRTMTTSRLVSEK
jgi:hypothetical protein